MARSFSRAYYVLVLLLVGFLYLSLNIALEESLHPKDSNAELLKSSGKLNDRLQEEPVTKYSSSDAPVRALERCEWIKELLQKNDSIGPPLPKPKEPRPGANVFWLKTPLLHTRDPESGDEVVVLKYNIYTKTQHIEKFNNTVSVLTLFPDATIFPKLYGYCKIEEFYHIVVEFIDQEPRDLVRPKDIGECVDRSLQVLSTFNEMDKLGLTLVDFKAGQWMIRKAGDFVLQDVDDIVPAPAKGTYSDQIDGFKWKIRRKTQLDLYEFSKLWSETIFPNGKLTIRYDVMGTSILLNNLGFSWKSCSGITPEFKKCFNDLIAWTETIHEDWPDFGQIAEALKDCYSKNAFVRTKGKRKSWHMVHEKPNGSGLNSCLRPYDKNSGAGSRGIFKCGNSCCRSKGQSPCYYTADSGLCEN